MENEVRRCSKVEASKLTPSHHTTSYPLLDAVSPVSSRRSAFTSPIAAEAGSTTETSVSYWG